MSYAPHGNGLDRDLQREYLAIVVLRGAPAFLEGLGGPDPLDLFAPGPDRLALGAARALALRGEHPTLDAIEAELLRAGANGAAADARAEVAAAIEAWGGTVPPGRAGRVLHELADLREASAAAGARGPEVKETPAGFVVGGLVFARAGTIEPEPVSWLVPDFIPLGMLSDLSSDPGVGKSSILASITAGITRGRVPLSRAQRAPGFVVLVSTEDALASIIVPRLRAEGADLGRVALYDTRADQPLLALPSCMPAIEALVKHTGAEFVGLDPAIEFMDEDLDSHRQQDVARFMAPLNGLGHRTGAAVLTSRHWNKTLGLSALYKAAGSIGFVAKARVAMVAAFDKAAGSRVLSVTKTATSAKHSVTFDVVGRDGASVVAWGEPTAITADDLVAQDVDRQGARGPAPAKREAAADFLRDLLCDGPMRKEDVIKQARTARAGGRTLVYEAAKVLGLKAVTVCGKAGWRLPPRDDSEGLP